MNDIFISYRNDNDISNDCYNFNETSPNDIINTKYRRFPSEQSDQDAEHCATWGDYGNFYSR